MLRVNCINNAGLEDYLAVGNIYEVEDEYDEDCGWGMETWYKIKAGDDGGLVCALATRFEIVEEP